MSCHQDLLAMSSELSDWLKPYFGVDRQRYSAFPSDCTWACPGPAGPGWSCIVTWCWVSINLLASTTAPLQLCPCSLTAVRIVVTFLCPLRYRDPTPTPLCVWGLGGWGGVNFNCSANVKSSWSRRPSDLTQSMGVVLCASTHLSQRYNGTVLLPSLAALNNLR